VAEGHGEAVEWLDEFVEIVRSLHAKALDLSGGLAGEHPEKLQAACARPFHTAFGEFLYHTSWQMSAALLHGIVTGHVFVDGNKRTGSLASLWLLTALNHSIEEPSSLQIRMLGEVAVETASGGVTVEDAAFLLERIFAPRDRARS